MLPPVKDWTELERQWDGAEFVVALPARAGVDVK